MSNVLIVEDHYDTAQLLERMLRYTGHEAVAVPTGSEALRLMSLRPPDVVILDCNMPDMDGMEVLRAIRSEASTWDLPVIVYTADVTQACEDRARQLGPRRSSSRAARRGTRC